MDMQAARRRIVLVLGLTLAATACADDGRGPLDETTASTIPLTEPAVTDPTDDPTDDPTGGTEPTQPEQPTTVVSGPVATVPATDVSSTTLQLVIPKSTTTTNIPTTDGVPVGSDDSLYSGRFDAGLDPFIDLAIADLALRLGVEADEITAISAVLVTWSDSSLGCPVPGMKYLQALQDGSVIELGYAMKVYRYHSGGNRTPFLCDQPLAKPPRPATDA